MHLEHCVKLRAGSSELVRVMKSFHVFKRRRDSRDSITCGRSRETPTRDRPCTFSCCGLCRAARIVRQVVPAVKRAHFRYLLAKPTENRPKSAMRLCRANTHGTRISTGRKAHGIFANAPGSRVGLKVVGGAEIASVFCYFKADAV